MNGEEHWNGRREEKKGRFDFIFYIFWYHLNFYCLCITFVIF